MSVFNLLLFKIHHRSFQSRKYFLLKPFEESATVFEIPLRRV